MSACERACTFEGNWTAPQFEDYYLNFLFVIIIDVILSVTFKIIISLCCFHYRKAPLLKSGGNQPSAMVCTNKLLKFVKLLKLLDAPPRFHSNGSLLPQNATFLSQSHLLSRALATLDSFLPLSPYPLTSLPHVSLLVFRSHCSLS